MNLENIPSNLKVTQCRAKDNYVLWVKFSDGISGEVNLSDLVGKGVFDLWKSADEFKKVKIDPVSGTVCWSDSIDLDPYVLHEDIRH